MSDKATEIRQAISGLEAQRELLGDAVIGSAVAALQQQLEAIDSRDAGALEVDGERKLVTIMFADISGFTALAEIWDPEEVRNIMNGCFETLVPVIQRFGGTVDKFIGDAVMALFGAAIAHEDDAERALLCSVNMCEALKQFNGRRGTSLNVHFGINSGEVVTGAIGSSGRQDYSVMGDAVNIAARLEDLSQPGEILVGPATFKQAVARFDFEVLPPVTLKGKCEPMLVYRLLGEKVDCDQSHRFTSSLHGRDKELAQLRLAVQTLQGGAGAHVLIVGDAGLGKSRLIAEARPSYGFPERWVEVRLQSHGQAVGFGMVRELILRLLQCSSTDSQDKVRVALRSAASSLPDAEEAYAHLATLAGLHPDEDMAAHTGSVPLAVLQERFSRSVAALLVSFAKAGPLVLVCEDLHWADSSSLVLLRAVCAFVERTPLLIILSYRPGCEAEAVFAGVALDQKILLQPLKARESRAIVDELLQIDNLSADKSQLILARAEGNPFFLEELVQALIESGAAAIENGRAVVIDKSDQFIVPPTLHGVVMARLDLLPRPAKRTLQTAAVIGRVFELRVITRVFAERPELQSRLPVILDDLRGRDFVSVDPASAAVGSTYSFKHGLTQDVAYQSLLKARRRELHSAVGDVLAKLFADQSGSISTVLAFHFENAGRAVDAAFHLLRSADAARASFANLEALAFYRRVIASRQELIAESPEIVGQLVSAYEGLGDLLELRGQHLEALEAFEAAIELVGEGEIQRAGLMRRCGGTLISRRQGEEAIRWYEAAEEILTATPSAAESQWWNEWIEIQLDRLWALYWLGDIAAMRSLTAATEARTVEFGNLGQRARLLKSTLLIRFREERGELSDATVELARRSLTAAEDSGDANALVQAFFAMGFTLLWRDQLKEADKMLNEARALAERIGNAEYQVLSLSYLTVLHRKAGDIEATESLVAAAAKAAEGADMELYVAVAAANGAWAALRRGALKQARAAASQAIKHWEISPFPVQWLARWPMLSLAIRKGNWDDAGSQARAILGPSQHQMPPPVRDGLARAVACLDAGDVTGAASILNGTLSEAQRRGMA